MSLIQANIKKYVASSCDYKLACVDDIFSKPFKSYFRAVKGINGKIFENLRKNMQNLKIFWKVDEDFEKSTRCWICDSVLCGSWC